MQQSPKWKMSTGCDPRQRSYETDLAGRPLCGEADGLVSPMSLNVVMMQGPLDRRHSRKRSKRASRRGHRDGRYRPAVRRHRRAGCCRCVQRGSRRILALQQAHQLRFAGEIIDESRLTQVPWMHPMFLLKAAFWSTSMTRPPCRIGIAGCGAADAGVRYIVSTVVISTKKNVC